MTGDEVDLKSDPTSPKSPPSIIETGKAASMPPRLKSWPLAPEGATRKYPRDEITGERGCYWSSQASLPMHFLRSWIRHSRDNWKKPCLLLYI